uniref:Variant surface glycoprotein 380 n=1 Tax=Trypanosoma brucei TaxID=5691 RepID=M4SZY2_9TRYP|nr:variant surface glycoprotein 380 [Trypanosoma brucei]
MARKSTELALLLLLNIAAASLQVPGYDTAGGKVTNVCEEATYAYALAYQLEQRLEPLKISVAKLKNSALAHAMAAAQTDDVQRKRGSAALAALAQSRYATAALNLQTSQQKTLEATTALKNRVAQILAAAKKHITGESTPSDTVYSASNNKMTGGEVCSFTSTYKGHKNGDCDFSKINEGTIKAADTKPNEITKINLSPDALFQLRTLNVKAEAKGNIGTTPPTTDTTQGSCYDAGSAANPTTTGITAEVTAPATNIQPTDVDILEGDGTQKTCVTLQPNKQSDAPLTLKHLRSKLCEALNAPLTAPPTPEEETLAALSSDTELVKILLAVDGKDKPAANTATADLIKHALGPDDTAYKSNFKKPVTTQQQSISIGGSKITGTLLTIAAGVDGPKTHAYLLGQEAKRTLAAKSLSDQQSEATATQKQCDTHSDKTAEECTKLGFDHDAEKKKCKAKPGANGAKAEGTEEKTTDKCKGKLEPECTKAPECKWDGETCKDSSFLDNNKFALISAAFVSLVSF